MSAQQPEGGRGLPVISPRLLDRIEQGVILLAWVGLVWRVAHSLNGYAPLLLISETAVMVFTVIRRPTEAISLKLGDWLLAITATAAPLLVVPGQNLLPQLAGLGVMLVLIGNVIQALAKFSLRRSFGIAPANRGVKVSGLYRYVRHPMYAGYLLVHIGNLLLFSSVVNGLLYAIGWTAQIRRLLAEEALLSEDEAYRAYMARQRWRLVPGLF
ncbi:MAG TPA: isoprenylcysteine carboxylmethyltransferase family protein [Novosphingobium sp.]|nr:isoprenylcysteine carboxylmethyltransferase family protein [Novosphingobium sp.]